MWWRTTVIGLGFVLALLATIAMVTHVWIGIGNVVMGWHGILAMVGGLLLAAGLGMGLMVLVFYSHRSGHDRTVDHGPYDHDHPRF